SLSLSLSLHAVKLKVVKEKRKRKKDLLLVEGKLETWRQWGSLSFQQHPLWFLSSLSRLSTPTLLLLIDILLLGQELLASSGPWVEMATAADLIQRRQRSEFLSNIKDTLFKALKGNPDLISPILTLALNDAVTYDKATKSGGPNGSIRFSSELSRPENKGLSAAMSLLDEAKKEIDSYSKGGPISYADLIQYAAQTATKATFLASAIRKSGGNEEKGSLLYSVYGSNGQWGLFDRQFGRSDTEEPDPEGRVPLWGKATVQEMKDKFKAVGFGPRQ
ncbi:Ascorbate peroxidase 4 isoform 2, partial [Theobroma cacao]